MPVRDEYLSVLWPLFAVLIALSLLFGVKAGGDNLLKNKTAQSGMGSLERAGSVADAKRIILSWNQKAPGSRTQSEIENESFLSAILSNDGRMLTEIAKRSLVFDLFFIVFYCSALAVACLLGATEIAVRRRRKQKQSHLVTLGIGLAYVQILTASIDALQNFALWRVLRNSTSEFWPWLASSCSIVKYTLVVISLVYTLLAFIFWIVDHRRRPLNNRKPAIA